VSPRVSRSPYATSLTACLVLDDGATMRVFLPSTFLLVTASVALAACASEEPEDDALSTEAAVTPGGNGENIDKFCPESSRAAAVLCVPQQTDAAFAKLDSTFNGLRAMRICFSERLSVATKAQFQTMSRTAATKGKGPAEDVNTWSKSEFQEVKMTSDFLDPGFSILTTEKPDVIVWLTLNLDDRLENLPQDRMLFSPITLKKFGRSGGVTFTNAELQTKVQCTYLTR
jgi:hypothetical protein